MSCIKRIIEKRIERGTRPRLLEEQVNRLYWLKHEGWTARQLITSGGFHIDFVRKYYNAPLATK